MRSVRVGMAAGTSLLIAGCTLIELDRLVPAAAIQDAQSSGLPGSIKICTTGSQSAEAVANIHSSKHALVLDRVAALQTTLPSTLTRDTVVQAVFEHSAYASSNATATARNLLGQGPDGVAGAAPRPRSISPSDLTAFTRTVSEHVLRHTKSAPDDGGDQQQDPFWVKLKTYYTDYYRGEYVGYFGQAVDKPKISLTINDTEIANAAGVLIELLFDEILKPPYWLGSDKKYYPGGYDSTAKDVKLPTYVTVNKIKPTPISTSNYGCGMNVWKANTVNYLAQTFATAAAAESSLTIKSVGGLEVGLGIFGKFNFGDNNTLTSLLQALVPTAVKRLTLAFTVPILEAIDVEPPPPPPAGGQRLAFMALRSPTAKTTQADMVRKYSAMFTSGGGM